MMSTLTVWNAAAGVRDDAASAWRSGIPWRVSTCQRELLVFSGDERPAAGTAFEVFRGQAAYEFLLRVATGLESAVPGETNILGQLRGSWAAYEASSAPIPVLEAIVRTLFADAARVRSMHLQGIGGSSYGTLVRRLLRPSRAARVLVAGAGRLAASLLPALASFETALYARRPDVLAAGLPAHRFGCGEELAAATWADVLCFCLPAHTGQDAIWIGALRERPHSAVHLGLRRGDLQGWSVLPELRTLDDVFDLRRSQCSLRCSRIARAAEACRELAASRSLSGTSRRRMAALERVRHGWSATA